MFQPEWTHCVAWSQDVVTPESRWMRFQRVWETGIIAFAVVDTVHRCLFPETIGTERMLTPNMVGNLGAYIKQSTT